MKKNSKNSEIPLEELVMSNEEFIFIRKKLRIPQKVIGFLGKSASQTVISMLEQEENINPALVYQLLSGQYAPPEVVQALRIEYREKFAQRK